MKERRGERVKKIFRECLSAVAFLMILAILIGQLTELFRNKGEWPLPQDFYSYPSNSFDVVFLGASTIMTSVYPMQLYQDYGIVSYNLSSAEQSIGESYYLAKDVIKRHQPKVLMIDAGTITYGTTVSRAETLHHITDNMPLTSAARWEMILHLDPTDFLQYVFPLDLYHTKWKSLSEDDLKPVTRAAALGARINSIRSSSSAVSKSDPIDESYTLPKWSLTYIDKLIRLCNKTATKLVFVSLPYVSAAQSVYDNRVNAAAALSRYLRPYGVTHLNYMDRAGDFDIGPSDTWDRHHMNYWGATKFTAFIGKYLTEACGVSDRRGDPSYSFMDRKLAAYESFRWQRLLATANDTKTYLDVLRDAAKQEGYLVVLALNGEIAKTVDASLAARLNGLGTMTLLSGYGANSYLAVLNGNKVVCESDVRSRTSEETYKGTVGKLKVEAASSVTSNDSKAEIRINGRDYALNKAGLNVVVFNPSSGEMVDSSVISLSDGSDSLSHQ